MEMALRSFLLLAFLLLSANLGLAQEALVSEELKGFLAVPLAAFFGILAFITITTSAQYFISKDKAYFYYGFYLGFGLFFFLFWYELNFNYLGLGNHPAFIRFAFHAAMPILIGSYGIYCLFVVQFLNLKDKHLQAGKHLKRAARNFLAIIVIDQFFYCVFKYGFANIYESVYPPFRIVLLVLVVINSGYGVYHIYKVNSKLSRIILAGTACYFLGCIIGLYCYSYSKSGSNNLLIRIPTLFNQIGYLLEILFFSIGLGYRLTLAEREKTSAHSKYVQQLEENKALEIEKTKAEKDQAITELKSRLYTNITHEFRTPLTIIRGMAAQKDHPNAMQMIRRNTDKLMHLVDHLLNLSKLDAGQMKIDYRQIDVIAYLEYLGESFQSLADQKLIRLTIYSEVDKLWMDIDQEKLRQIISNLLSNAIKFTPEGGKIILHTGQENDQLSLKVKDSGIGIAAEELPLIFDRFYQVDHAHSRIGEGTGIGLALTKELVELMDGRISVQSIVGKGTTFQIELPIRRTALKVEAHLETAEPQNLSDDTPAPQWLIENDQLPLLLVIEDNVDVQVYIQSIIQGRYQILTATNGDVGIKLALEQIPDIIISDVMMPLKDGFEVLEILRADERTSHIPVVLLTAKATQEDKIAGLRSGADAYLMKPFDKGELLVRLEKLIEMRRQLQVKYQSYQLAPTAAAQNPEETFLKKINRAVLTHVNDPQFNVEALAAAAGMDRSQLYRKLKALTDQTPSQLINHLRLEKARELLQQPSLNISEVAYDVGYSDPAYFSRLFSKAYGESPNAFRQKLQ